jgi:hypothetical protein
MVYVVVNSFTGLYPQSYLHLYQFRYLRGILFKSILVNITFVTLNKS